MECWVGEAVLPFCDFAVGEEGLVGYDGEVSRVDITYWRMNK